MLFLYITHLDWAIQRIFRLYFNGAPKSLEYIDGRIKSPEFDAILHLLYTSMRINSDKNVPTQENMFSFRCKNPARGEQATIFLKFAEI